MEAVTFSKRLYGIPGMLIFLGLSISFGTSTVTHLQVNGTPQGTAWMIIGILVFMVVGTLGWRYCLSRRSVSWVRAYFSFQTMLFAALFWLENADAQSGAVFGNLSVVLLLQVSVLPWRSRLLLCAATTLTMVLISAAFLPPERIILPSILITLISGAVLLTGHLIVSEEQAREMLNNTNRKLTEYANQVEELATLRERNRLAREIHDNLGHYLAAVNMQIEAALALLETDQPRAVGSLTKAQALTKEGLAEIRRSIAALRAAPIEDRPLHEAITLLVEENRAAGLDIHYSVEGPIRPCSAQVEMALYRIAQEGLTNIRKHAQATRAQIRLKYGSDRQISLCVGDNGVGSAVADGGFGLVGIQERVKLLGGSLKIDTSQGQGFNLQVEIPA